VWGLTLIRAVKRGGGSRGDTGPALRGALLGRST